MSQSADSFWTNKPLRHLTMLAAVTFLAVIGAIVAVTLDVRDVRTKFVPVKLFEGLDTKLDHAAQIVVTLPRGMQGVDKLVINRTADGVWVLPGHGGYPARQDMVKNLLTGLGALEAYEPRTARAEWHRNLGLLAPEDLGSATRVEIFDDKKQRLAAMLAGKIPEESVDVQGQGMIYVRRDGEDQTWLARGRFPLAKVASDWLDTDFLTLPKDHIARVTLWAGSEHPATISRPSPDDPNFELENLAPGEISRGAPVMNGIANAIAEASFEDVAPEASITFPEASPHVVINSYDGLVYTIVMTGSGTSIWAKVSVDVSPDLAAEKQAAARDLAAKREARFKGWVYQIPSELAGILMQTKDVLTHEGAPAL